jgi:thiosulfate dehydrogenase
MGSLVCRNCRAGLLLAAVAMLTLPSLHGHTQTAVPSSDAIWTVPEVGALPDDDHLRLVRHGRDLVTATYAHIGPEVSDPSKRFAGNNLACGDCHLDAGTKKFGLPIFGIYNEFPKYSARLGAEITIEQRVNACMTRSMNGRAMPSDAPAMQALVAYIKFLSSGVPPDQRLSGLGAGKIPELDRAADPTRGRTIYVAKCEGCHNTDGSGIRRSLPMTDLGYIEPPLWGPDSFNDGAGMDRLMRQISFIPTCRKARIIRIRCLQRLTHGTSPPLWCRSRGRTSRDLKRIFPTWRKSRSMRPMDPISTASARNSTNTARLHPFARLWLG